MTLRELGHEVELGAGVAAAQRVFLEAGVPARRPERAQPKVLVKEKIGDSGVHLLRDAASTSSSAATGRTASSSAASASSTAS